MCEFAKVEIAPSLSLLEEADLRTLSRDNGSGDITQAIDPSSVLVTSGPSHGTVVVNANGTIVYTPTTGFAGTDNFAYVQLTPRERHQRRRL